LMKILCVDDDVLILNFFSEALKKAGVEEKDIMVATNGEHALDIMTREPADLIILDLLLPGISGIETLKAITSRFPKSEVIVVTGHASPESAVEAMKAGARDYITKPFNLNILKEKILTIFEFLSRRREAEEYRYAMEMVEEGVKKEITTLEEAIDAMKRVNTRILSIIESDTPDAQKIRLIRSVIDSNIKDAT
jgi:two-component system OmpR family response regulator